MRRRAVGWGDEGKVAGSGPALCCVEPMVSIHIDNSATSGLCRSTGSVI